MRHNDTTSGGLPYTYTIVLLQGNASRDLDDQARGAGDTENTYETVFLKDEQAHKAILVVPSQPKSGKSGTSIVYIHISMSNENTKSSLHSNETHCEDALSE